MNVLLSEYDFSCLNKKIRLDFILIILICINLLLNSLVNSSFSNYYFSESFIPIVLKEYRFPLLIINVLILIITIIMYSIKKTKIAYRIKIFQNTMLKVLTIITAICGLLCNLTIGYYSFISTNFVISGNSMYPTYQDQSTATLKFTSKFKRFDVVVFKTDSYNLDADFPSVTPYYIKRIIGLPGDKVVLENNILYINDSIVKESYISKPISDFDYLHPAYFNGLFKYKLNGEIKYSSIIPNGYCFVLGDNRNVNKSGNNFVNCSFDSREFGLVPFDIIIGVVS